MNFPAEGEMWKHYKGGIYQIIALGRDEATLEAVVIYRSTKDEQVLVRPMTAFMGTVDENGYVPRFERMEVHAA